MHFQVLKKKYHDIKILEAVFLSFAGDETFMC